MAEYWDIYDKDRNKTGRLAERDVYKLKEGEYHIVTIALILNSKNEMLITRRAPTKKHEPLKWELTGGSIVTGETSLNGMLREIREEIGVTFQPEDATFVTTTKRNEIARNFKDIWLFKKDLKKEDITFTDVEVIDSKWVSIEELLELQKNKETVRTMDFGIKEYKLALEKLK